MVLLIGMDTGIKVMSQYVFGPNKKGKEIGNEKND